MIKARSMRKRDKPLLDAFVRQGAQVNAEYDEAQEVPMYRGIPTLEALGPILSKNEVVARLASIPPYCEADRQLRPEVLLHVVQGGLLSWFCPLAIHIDLQQRLDRVIRGCLPYRNPLRRGYYRENSQQVDHFKTYLRNPLSAPYQRTTALGFHFTAPSGLGKTTSLERILMELYPQRIIHTEYKGRPFQFDQLVWLHLDCPGDGSLKQLLLQFLQAVDAIIGKTQLPNGEHVGYYELYGETRATVDSLISAVAAVATNHCLSVLIIDEVQHLLEADGDGADKVLGYLVTLVNTIGLPIILVGTPRAKRVLSKHGRQIRRGTGQGELTWNRLDRNCESYSLMTQSMWTYQYTAKPVGLTNRMNDVLFEETQGIPDYIIKAYMMAQWRSLTTRKPLSPAILRSVAKDGFESARPILRALRLNNFADLENLDDIVPPDINPILQAATDALNMEKAATDCANPTGVGKESTSRTPVSQDPSPVPTNDMQDTDEESAAGEAQSPGLEYPTLKQLSTKAKETGEELYDIMRAHSLVDGLKEAGLS